MPAKAGATKQRAAPKEEEAVEPTGAVDFDGDLVVGAATTITLKNGPNDHDVTFSVAPPGGGAFERVVHTDENGAASLEVVPSSIGELDVVVTKTDVKVVGSATADVVGSVAPVPLALEGIEPTESVVGPPQSFTLLINGEGFDHNTRASFGVFSKEEAEAGLGEEGEPKWEPTTRYMGPTQLGLPITGGLFPNPDSDIPVYVGQPDGTTAGPVSFAFVPLPEEKTDG
jgi:hypothetical protein